ncbi:hypothetical protein [Gordonia sihwensis]|uniref:hypothetical protein n=1 Tax=Gordonia sihwensis TaxID=173559 RepID=UPI003D9807CC
MTQPTTIEELASRIDPREAQLFAAHIMAMGGRSIEWGADELGYVANRLAEITKPDGLEFPSPYLDDRTEEENQKLADYWNGLYRP